MFLISDEIHFQTPFHTHKFIYENYVLHFFPQTYMQCKDMMGKKIDLDLYCHIGFEEKESFDG